MNNPLYSEKEYKKTYSRIKNILLNEKSKENYPLAALVGGQPGSGKSELTKYLLSQDRNMISIDGDYIRLYHPHLNDIQKKYGVEYPKITQPFVNRIVEQLIDELSKEQYNLIIEGTLRDINVPLKTAALLDGRNYIVELYVIATNKDLSWQSTIDRGDEMKKNGEIPRYVDKAHHDNIVKTLPSTIEELSKSNLLYNIVIMKRNQEIIYDRNEMPDINSKDIMEKSLNGEEISYVNDIAENKEEKSPEELIEIAEKEIELENHNRYKDDKNLEHDER